MRNGKGKPLLRAFICDLRRFVYQMDNYTITAQNPLYDRHRVFWWCLKHDL